MRTLYIPLTLLLALSFSAFTVLGPSINFKSMAHDFGRIPQGTPVKCEFEFTNDGNAPLILVDVKASCGCTTPEWPKDPIMPGETKKIIAEYNAKADGAFDKTISVYTNVNDDVIKLNLKGFVYKVSIVDDEEEEGGTELKLGGG